jgi:uncharacterized membrane-anchored protein YjiN (DUF445 family)
VIDLPLIGKIEKYGLEDVVLKLDAEGKSSREIAAWLEKNKKRKINRSTIANFLKSVRTERAEMSKSIVQEHIQKSLPTDLQRLDQVLGVLYDALPKDKENIDKKSLFIFDRWLKGLELKLKNSGAGENTAEDILKAVKERWGLEK